jgi:hypothetical protein
MDSKQIRILIGTFGLVAAAWLFSLLLFSAGEPGLPLSRAALQFDASRAYKAAGEFVTQHPRRVLGSIESRQSTGYLKNYLESLGYEVDYSHFEARIARKKKVGRNVFAHKKGQNDEILAIIAHFDTAETSFQGAMKNGAAVGVLLEMARVFARSSTRRSLLIILSDGGEWGALGAGNIAAGHPDRSRIAAVLSLDHVGIGDLAAFKLDVAGQLKGYSPPWLRTAARRAAEDQRLPVKEPSILREHLERAFLIPRADQGPFLKAGIPAVNLGSRSADREREKAVYHSAEDTLDNLSADSIERYGRAAERLLRSLDEAPSIPRRSPESLRLWDSLFVNPKAVTALHIISFLPLPAIFCFHLINSRRQWNRVLAGREALAYAATLLPLLIVYLSIAFFRALRLIPLYTLYPATAKDPVLTNPPWAVLGGILGTALFVAIVCCVIAKYSFRSLPKPDFRISRLVLLGFLIIAAALALGRNSYWAFTFLMLPSWIWALAGPGRQTAGRARSRVWILAAGIPYYLTLWLFGPALDPGWNSLWYQVLALSTGLFTAGGYFLWAVVVALGIRFLAIQGHTLPA